LTVTRQVASFSGTVTYGWPTASAGPTLLIFDVGAFTDAELDKLGPKPVQCISIDGRPTQATVDDTAVDLVDQGGGRLVAVGSGALLDAAKLSYQRARDAGAAVELVMVPCGPEPYRAVAQFAVVDAPDRSRPTVVDPRFAAAEVVVIPELLRRLSTPVIGVAAADAAVQAFESLLSSAASPYSRLLAASALKAVADVSAPASVITGSFLAVESFASTKLGLAHAIASPLGTSLGITHDAINAVLGDALIDYWAPRVVSFGHIRRACEADSPEDVKAFLARLRRTAALPDSLAELGIKWESIAEVLPRAAMSSGMSVLPRTVSATELEAFAARAWKGTSTKEDALAEPAGAN
jgi:alcohol dehydrogenase class IV